MTAMADAAIQKITEVQQAAQWHSVRTLKRTLIHDNAQKGKIKKRKQLHWLLYYYYAVFRNNDFMIL